MTDESRQIVRRNRRVGGAARVLLIILGTVLILFGSILSLASLAIALEGDPSILIMAPFSLSTLIGGVFIILSQGRAGEERLISGPETAATLPAATIPQQAPATHTAIPAPATPPALPPDSSAPTKADSSAEDVAHLVHRSDDLFATLRDLVRRDGHPEPDLRKHHLADMLRAAGIMQLTDAPTCEGGRLSRTGHFWIRANTDHLDDAHYDMLIATEAALSTNQDLADIREMNVADESAQLACAQLMVDMCDQRVERCDLTKEGLRVCYHDENAAGTPEEWVLRSSLSNACECLRTPFRVVCDFRSNLDDGLVVTSVEIARPRCFAIFTPDNDRRHGLARAYAFRLAYLIAAHALGASSRATHCIVNCHERGGEDVLLSMDVDRKMLPSLRKVAKSTAIEGGFPSDARIRAAFAGAWFAPVEPFVDLHDVSALPDGARTYPELDTREAPEAIVRTCGAKRICDLGINENAVRIDACDEIMPLLGDSTEKAVSQLVAARDAADDITVAEACTRTMQALVDGTGDLEDREALSALFINGSALDTAVRRAIDYLDDTKGPENPEAAIKVLEAALAPIDDMGVYLDDDSCVYRYFGSFSERISHNTTIDEGGREIRLVPDAYFNAHSNLSIALGMVGRNEEALAHADTCLRLAPTSTYAAMRKVRVLESESRVYEAVELIIEALRHANTPRAAAICHYRLAYMEWKLGREDLAVACYQRSMSWDTDIVGQSKEELEDLLNASPELERLSDEQADALLAREGIPLGCVRTDGEHTLAAAVACMDNGAFYTARTLMAVLFGMNGDDVVMGVYRSLEV